MSPPNFSDAAAAQAAARRGLDIAVAATALLVTLPLWGGAALAVRLQDGGPAFFRQERVGLHGRRFRMWKIRTMVPDAERRGGWQTAAGDPRITPLGRWLRRTSIDELPQLINVLAGDMSLVGPRPDTPAQQAGYDPEDWALRCSVRPGLTGPAQVASKSGAAPPSRLEIDLDYVRNRSLRRDLAVLLRTLGTVLQLRNR
ncbi:sugar transferase [Rhodobacteraceae bacterium 2CG4]|uniref:Sugar transferase n=1 Tax=Halovulum marinum TaxID=2662447 RepID=A0A6L5YZH2_9RHOB|nr:sugar transferase [Halovulum marinum]MSU89673.1 sugar transferase [Halovulum marinum]